MERLYSPMRLWRIRLANAKGVRTARLFFLQRPMPAGHTAFFFARLCPLGIRLAQSLHLKRILPHTSGFQTIIDADQKLLSRITCKRRIIPIILNLL